MRWSILCVLFGLVVSAGAQGQALESADVKMIDTLYADYRVAVERADIQAYVDALHPDVRLLPPGADAIVGAANYAGFLEPVFETATYKIEVLKMPVIEVFGDIAVAEYEYIINLNLKNPEVGVTEPGALTDTRTRSRYFDVLKKNSNGVWAIWRHTWNTLPE